MNRQEFEDTARRYREEMFRMYANQSISPPPKPLPAAPPPQPTPAPPVMAEPAAPPPKPEPAKRPYTGTIRVHVSTGHGARPITGATVTISRIIDGHNDLVSVQQTNDSGNIQPVTVPAPPPSADQRAPESYMYDLTVRSGGFYREHSTDVPVFPNVTSVQNFDLIPLPAGSDAQTDGTDLTFYNDLPQY